jgi:thiamine transport system substrate-binding protein
VDYGDVCINYDKIYFAAKQLAIPQSLDACSITVCGCWWWRIYRFIPGMAFLLATIAQYGEDDYLNYWQQLKDNGLVVVNDWETLIIPISRFFRERSAAHGGILCHQSGSRSDLCPRNLWMRLPRLPIIGPKHLFPADRICRILKGTSNVLWRRNSSMPCWVYPSRKIFMNMFVLRSTARRSSHRIRAVQPDPGCSCDPYLYTEIAASRDAWIAAWQGSHPAVGRNETNQAAGLLFFGNFSPDLLADFLCPAAWYHL